MKAGKPQSTEGTEQQTTIHTHKTQEKISFDEWINRVLFYDYLSARASH
jgi:hypothetical protein